MEPHPTFEAAPAREIAADFRDRGLPAVTSAEEGASQRDAARDLIMMGKYARLYQCLLNTAGVSLDRVQPVAGCQEDIVRLSTELSDLGVNSD